MSTISTVTQAPVVLNLNLKVAPKSAPTVNPYGSSFGKNKTLLKESVAGVSALGQKRIDRGASSFVNGAHNLASGAAHIADFKTMSPEEAAAAFEASKIRTLSMQGEMNRVAENATRIANNNTALAYSKVKGKGV